MRKNKQRRVKTSCSDGIDWHEHYFYDETCGRLYRKSHGSINSQGYRVVIVKDICVMEHRAVWEMHNGPIPEGLFIDHINGLRADNRIENLRLCTKQQNAFNRRTRFGKNSKSKGVQFIKATGKYKAVISVDRIKKDLGYFDTEAGAARAYNDAAKQMHGDFAWLNEVIDG